MNFRYDIQALRGYAVLLILLFHAGIGPFKVGYLGVDIFFVVSGFLITSLLVKHINNGDFSFKEFYYRRAKRLLPAAYVVILFTTIGSCFFLTANDFGDYKNQLLGAITFTANFALYDQSGYFDSAAEMKPLLHMWSLAIEEQFYLFLPLALFFLPRKLWKSGAILLVSLSLALCMATVRDDPNSAFYFLPTRAWELGLGSIGALNLTNGYFKRICQKSVLLALGILIFIPVYPVVMLHPGPDAFLVCLATLILLVANMDAKGVVVRGLAKIGDYSYSLYLVHWPLFAFTANGYMGDEIPLAIRVSLLVISFILAIILYVIVERPIHKAEVKQPKKLATSLLVSSLLLAVLIVILSSVMGSGKDYDKIRRVNRGLGDVCSQAAEYGPGTELHIPPECKTAESPRILLWGDSYAMHLAHGLASVEKAGLIQATMSSCGPFADISHIKEPEYSEKWAKNCIEFNRSVLEYLAIQDSVEIVILSSPFVLSQPGGAYLSKNGDDYQRAIIEKDTALIAMNETIRRIKVMGKKAVIISPPPNNGYDTSSCQERKETYKLSFGKHAKCEISLSKAKEQAVDIYDFLERLPKEANVNVVSLPDFLCKGDSCSVTLDNQMIYRDIGHLSYQGSIAIFNNYNLLKEIHRHAK